MVDPSITREWTSKADEDFEFARINLDEGKNFYAQICSAKDPSFEGLKEDSEFLAAFYVGTRYPVHWPTKFSKEEAQKTLLNT